MSPIRKNAGFSLIEMAVVLVITGLILGTVIGAMNVQMSGQRIKQTQERQQVIKEALINYIRQNSRLPCPAPITANTGVAALPTNNCNGTITLTDPVSGELARKGAVPWLTLGLPAESVKDAYGRFFTYIVSDQATTRTAQTIPGLTGNMPIFTGTTQINPCTGICDNLAVVILISHGVNGYGAYYGTSDTIDFPATPDAAEAGNADTDTTFHSEDYQQNGYDDIFAWFKPSEILEPLIASGSIKDYRGINNQRFEQITIELAAAATRIAGGCGSGASDGYQITSLSTSIVDIWGNVITTSLQDNSGNPITVNASTPKMFCANDTDVITMRSTGYDTANSNDDQISILAADQFLAYAIKLH